MFCSKHLFKLKVPVYQTCVQFLIMFWTWLWVSHGLSCAQFLIMFWTWLWASHGLSWSYSCTVHVMFPDDCLLLLLLMTDGSEHCAHPFRGPTSHLRREVNRRKRGASWCKNTFNRKVVEKREIRDALYCKEMVSFAEAVSAFSHLEPSPIWASLVLLCSLMHVNNLSE